MLTMLWIRPGKSSQFSVPLRRCAPLRYFDAGGKSVTPATRHIGRAAEGRGRRGQWPSKRWQGEAQPAAPTSKLCACKNYWRARGVRSGSSIPHPRMRSPGHSPHRHIARPAGTPRRHPGARSRGEQECGGRGQADRIERDLIRTSIAHGEQRARPRPKRDPPASAPTFLTQPHDAGRGGTERLRMRLAGPPRTRQDFTPRGRRSPGRAALPSTTNSRSAGAKNPARCGTLDVPQSATVNSAAPGSVRICAAGVDQLGGSAQSAARSGGAWSTRRPVPSSNVRLGPRSKGRGAAFPTTTISTDGRCRHRRRRRRTGDGVRSGRRRERAGRPAARR